MSKMLRSAIFILAFCPLLASGLQRPPVILACAHVQVCNVIDEILSNNNQQGIDTVMPFQIQGDPHHFEPGPQVVKQLLELPKLLLPSHHLTGWSGKIIEQRQQNKDLKTYELEILKDPELTQEFTKEALAHFWLHPDALCQAKKEIAGQLAQWEVLKGPPEISCSLAGPKLLGKKLKERSQNTPLVLYHEALMPYLSSLGVEVTGLKGAGHAEQVSVSRLKEFHRYLAKHPKVLWVRESSIHIHSQLKDLQREADLNVQIDTLGKRHSPSTQTLTDALKKILLHLPPDSGAQK